MYSTNPLDRMSNDDLSRLRHRYETLQNYEAVSREFNISVHYVKKALSRAGEMTPCPATVSPSAPEAYNGAPDAINAATLVRNWMQKGAEAGARGEIYGINVQVTPQIAAELLKCNTNNRNINKEGLKFFETALRDGRFFKLSAGPSVSKTGVLNDGQHKLTAIVNTGITAPMFLHFGEEDIARSAHDSGGAGKRTAAQALRIEFRDGIKNTTVVATATRYIVSNLLGNSPKLEKIRHEQYVGQVGKTREQIVQSATEAVRVAHRTGAPEGALAAVHYTINKMTKHPDKFNGFWEKLVEPTELAIDDPRYALSSWITQKHYKRGKSRTSRAHDESARLLMGTVIRTWNRYVKGERIKHVAWNPDTPFPTPL